MSETNVLCDEISEREELMENRKPLSLCRQRHQARLKLDNQDLIFMAGGGNFDITQDLKLLR